MGLFGSVSSKQVDDFAKSLVQEIAQHFPVAPGEDKRRNSDKKRLSVIRDVLRKAKDFSAQHKLGVYKKARLANTFRWELQEKGYNTEFIEFATEGLVMRMTGKD
jgi:hypothetical protein